MKYQNLEHTADLKIKAFGKDKKELFENAMLGMFKEARYESIKTSPVLKREIKISSYDLLSLLVDFLSKVLYLSEVNQEVYEKVEFNIFDDKKIEGVLFGKKLQNKEIVIKGVTYHDLDIHQIKAGSWKAIVLFDI